MISTRFFVVGLLFVALFTLCSKDTSTGPSEEPPVITGTVIGSADSSRIEHANVLLYDANTNEPISRMSTNENGICQFTASEPGTYYLKIEAQGYYPVPMRGGAPLPFQASLNDTARREISLDPDPQAASLGGFQGHVVSDDEQAVAGAPTRLNRAGFTGGEYTPTTMPTPMFKHGCLRVNSRWDCFMERLIRCKGIHPTHWGVLTPQLRI